MKRFKLINDYPFAPIAVGEIRNVFDEIDILTYRVFSQFWLELPEKKLVPFTYDDNQLFIGKAIKDKENKVISIISSCSDKNIYCHYRFSTIGFSYVELLEKYTFIDGTPCGKIVEL